MRRTAITAALFISAALIYFLPYDFPYRMCVPLALLTAASVGKLPWQMSLAFLFSLIGDACSSWRDWMGVDMAFIAKMGCFATAHVFFIIFFLRQWSARLSRNKYHVGGVTAAVLALAIFVLFRVVPEAPAGAVRLGVACYSLVISGMLYSALMTRDWVWGVSAIMFVYSDFVLAWNTFCSPVPGEKYLIMVPYYAAQLLFFVRTASKVHQGYNKVKHH